MRDPSRHAHGGQRRTLIVLLPESHVKRALKSCCRWLIGALSALGLAMATLHVGAQELRHGMQPPAEIGGELDLIDHHGARFALARLAGEPELLFFGFTHCGSTCPVALAEARQVLHTLGPAPQASIVFVTLDPLNDGPQQLREFVQRIHPRIVGLTGSPLQVERAAERYGVGVRVAQSRIEHSSMWYLLDGQARVRRVYAHTTPAADLVTDLRSLGAARGAR
jgi:protein SCO1/2